MGVWDTVSSVGIPKTWISGKLGITLVRKWWNEQYGYHDTSLPSPRSKPRPIFGFQSLINLTQATGAVTFAARTKLSPSTRIAPPSHQFSCFSQRTYRTISQSTDQPLPNVGSLAYTPTSEADTSVPIVTFRIFPSCG